MTVPQTDHTPPTSLRDFRAVYRTHHGFVWHALHRFGTASAALEDAVQDVFVVAYRRRSDFSGASTKAWLYGIARRVASNYRRSSRRRTQRERAIQASRGRLASADARDAIQALDRYLESLPSEDRELFILSELEGMTGPEIAELRGRNLQTVYTQIRKLRLEFRAELFDLEQVRRARPHATARSWAALVPLLGESVAPALGWTSMLVSPWIAGAVGAGVAAGVLLVADQVLPPPRDANPPAERVAHANAAGTPAPPPAHAPSPAPNAERTEQLPAETPQSPVLREAEPPRRRAAAEAPPRDRLAEENELLRRAATELRAGSADTAMRLTQQHAAQFPDSALADLRAALRIEALCGLGKAVTAREEAQEFLRASPNSPVARRIKESCAMRPQKGQAPDMAGT